MAHEGCARIRAMLLPLAELAEGCPDHPAYRAREAPEMTCKRCVRVWEARRRLKDIRAVAGRDNGY